MKVTDKKDYQSYLTKHEFTDFKNEKDNLIFWVNRLNDDQNQYPYLTKIAASNSKLFAITGDVKYLKEAESNLLEVNINHSSSGTLRSLARNYISQHRFNEALE